ncbi:hypothetical protein LTR47_006662 [Exophiala xenobiotica]|nr:hypothetical protein LTR47_006662 [Exophiala xenobiotica]KAK5363647.1 hypothetical protein LTR11_009075 [Exophiala xenobiotica]KAK5365012.1 hypothetical protein LTS03_009072 [Exophiala xenobiotica]
MVSTHSLIHHPNGQTTHIVDDNFTDPWKPSETILIQHGFARHTAFWYHWVPVLSRQYRVIRRDLRGHGLSSTGDDPNYDYSVQTICDEIIDTLDQLKIDRVHFLGESTSGMLGEILAARHPDRLHSLIICSRGWGEALAQFPGTLSITDPEYTSWWKDQVAVSSGEGLAKYAQFLSTLDSRPFLKDVRIPMLILAPANSAATRLEEQKSIKEAIPNAELVVINGKGHEIYVEMAEECQKAVLNFLHGLRQRPE